MWPRLSEERGEGGACLLGPVWVPVLTPVCLLSSLISTLEVLTCPPHSLHLHPRRPTHKCGADIIAGLVESGIQSSGMFQQLVSMSCMILALSLPSVVEEDLTLMMAARMLTRACMLCLQSWYLIPKKILWIFTMAWILIPAVIEVTTTPVLYYYIGLPESKSLVLN